MGHLDPLPTPSNAASFAAAPAGHLPAPDLMHGILFAAFIHENRNQSLATPLPLTSYCATGEA
jgi:hypothetical protein